MAIATVACPKCKQTFRSTDDVKGTRIRCPLCGVAFVVEKFVGEGPPVGEEKKANSWDEEDDPNPLGMTTVELKARCPNCANEMQNADAIICVYCGYNTQSRKLGKTEHTVHQTGADKFQWLLPGIGCLVAVFVLIFLQNIYILKFGVESRGSDSWVNMIYTEPVYLWVTMIGAGIIWTLGRFAFKRLVVEPTPPEQSVN
jgi:DNA-directed RNA polymerase subunit RPC12/RpoP